MTADNQNKDFQNSKENNSSDNKAECLQILAKLGFKGEKQKRVKILLLALLIGIILMIFSSCGGLSLNSKSAENESNILSDGFSTAAEEKQLECKLSEVLGKIKGVGDVSVSVTLASGSKTEYAVNASTTVNSTNENNADGSEKSTTQTTSTNDIVFRDSNKNPVIVQEKRAEVQGVLIVAEGGENPEVCLQITAAVSALLDIPAHKITVCGSANEDD